MSINKDNHHVNSIGQHCASPICGGINWVSKMLVNLISIVCNLSENNHIYTPQNLHFPTYSLKNGGCRLLSFYEGLFSRAILASGRVDHCKLLEISSPQITKKTEITPESCKSDGNKRSEEIRILSTS